MYYNHFGDFVTVIWNGCICSYAQFPFGGSVANFEDEGERGERINKYLGAAVTLRAFRYIVVVFF